MGELEEKRNHGRRGHDSVLLFFATCRWLKTKRRTDARLSLMPIIVSVHHGTVSPIPVSNKDLLESCLSNTYMIEGIRELREPDFLGSFYRSFIITFPVVQLTYHHEQFQTHQQDEENNIDPVKRKIQNIGHGLAEVVFYFAVE